MYLKSLEISERLGDEPTSANQYGNLGSVHLEMGQFDEAIRMSEKALEICQRIGDEPGMAKDYGNLAIVYKQKGDTARALEYYDKSLKISERIGDQHTCGHTVLQSGHPLPPDRRPRSGPAALGKGQGPLRDARCVARCPTAARALQML